MEINFRLRRVRVHDVEYLDRGHRLSAQYKFMADRYRFVELLLIHNWNFVT